MSGTIQNRDKFLDKIANRLGHSRTKSSSLEKPTWKYMPQLGVLKNATQADLLELLKEQCKKIHTSLYTTDSSGLSSTLAKVVNEYGGGPIVRWKDERFSNWGLDPLFQQEWPNQNIEVYEWDYTKGAENVKKAEHANIGITISEATLAESGTVVLFSGKERGRTVGFLPEALVVLIPISSLVPRLTQATRKIREIYLKTGHMPSCVNFISGPSNSADIELNLVVGVHGPAKATYIVINDL